jgi:hypothetical protein
MKPGLINDSVRKLCLSALLPVTILVTCLPAQKETAVPSPTRTITLTSRLESSARHLYPGQVEITFSIYRHADSTDALWAETQMVSVNEAGEFTASLGGKAGGLPAELFLSGDARWLGVQPSGVQESPRALLMAVGYSIIAGNALQLNGRSGEDFLLREQLHTEVRRYFDEEIEDRLSALSASAGVVGSTSLSTGQFDSIEISEGGSISTIGIIDAHVTLVPKLFLSASGSPSLGGTIPSLTFRSTNPAHMFGEVAFQDSTSSPGQDIWALQQDSEFTGSESLVFRRRGQPVLLFNPLGTTGSDVLTTWSGTRMRFERSGPYPLEFRDTSLGIGQGLWRNVISENCWIWDKNNSPFGDFSQRSTMLELCPTTVTIPSAKLNPVQGIAASFHLPVSAGGPITLTATAPNAGIFLTPGQGGVNVLNARTGIRTDRPAGSLHVLSSGNLQDAIFEASGTGNHGISIRNAVQNWAAGIRADRGQAFNLRNISADLDALLLSPTGDLSLLGTATVDRSLAIKTASETFDWRIDASGTLNLSVASAAGRFNAMSITTQGEVTFPSNGAEISAEGGESGMLRLQQALAPQKAKIFFEASPSSNVAVEVSWSLPLSDTDYVASCTAQSSEGMSVLRIASVEPHQVTVILSNSSSLPQQGYLHCIALP